jgi:hypothetical protein
LSTSSLQARKSAISSREPAAFEKSGFPWRDEEKEAGARVIYYVYDQTLPVYLLLAYAKNERDDLSSEQKTVLRRLVETILARKPT